MNVGAVAEAWQTTAMQYSVASTYASTAMLDKDTLLQLVQCKQTDILPAAVVQHSVTCSAL